MLLGMTYVSDSYRVKGYLYVPTGGPRLEPEALRRATENYYQVKNLPAVLLASSLPQQERPVRKGAAADVDGDAVLHSACVAGQGPDPGLRSATPVKRPLLVYCRGGAYGFGKVRTHWMEQFASLGHVVFAPCYRGNEGGEGRDAFGGADVEDVVSAVRFLRTLPFVDGEHVTLLGFSRGAINAARAAVELRGEVNRLVLWSGVSDLTETYRERPDLRRTLQRMVGGAPEQVPAAYRERSPLLNASKLACPVLVVHGTEDHQVPYAHGDRMVRRLTELGASVELHRYDGAGHLFEPPLHAEAVRRMLEWAR